MKLHYFDNEKADEGDMLLAMAKAQGYVPTSCLLGGMTIMDEIKRGADPCAGCNGPREKCNGRPKKSTTKPEGEV